MLTQVSELLELLATLVLFFKKFDGVKKFGALDNSHNLASVSLRLKPVYLIVNAHAQLWLRAGASILQI